MKYLLKARVHCTRTSQPHNRLATGFMLQALSSLSYITAIIVIEPVRLQQDGRSYLATRYLRVRWDAIATHAKPVPEACQLLQPRYLTSPQQSK